MCRFVFFEVVQRCFQQCGLAHTTGAGVDAEDDRARHLELYAELVEVLDRIEF
ncbi:hypothetical protein D3C81_2291430 [compost metagenome]